MASMASKKKGHLEAGKKKLEEFRRKKAGKKAPEKAEKAVSTGEFHTVDGVPHVQKPLEADHVPNTAFNGTSIPGAVAEGHMEPKDIPEISSKESNISPESDFSATNLNAKLSISAINVNTKSSAHVHSYLDNEGHREGAVSVGLEGFGRTRDKLGNGEGHIRSSAQVSPLAGNSQFWDLYVSSIGEIPASGHSTVHGSTTDPSNNINGGENDLSCGNSGKTAIVTRDNFPQNSVPQPDLLSNGSLSDDRLHADSHPSSSRITECPFGYRPKFSADHVRSINHSSPWTYDNKDSDYDVLSSCNAVLLPPHAVGRRFRPSFLNSIQIPKDPSSDAPSLGAVKSDSPNLTALPLDGLGSSVSQTSAHSPVASDDEVRKYNDVKRNRQDFFSQKQNEDFAALEQHIEELTQEKFSLQRALEASRSLAESLASESSVLTDSYNQQGGVVNQLKHDSEKLQEEIKALLRELEAVRNEYANAQMECNAADERAKLLASEVVGLEEKALRLRSNELKLERQLENAQAELSSYSKKLSSLEKDRQDLLSTIAALQEEKKLLESKLQKASGKSVDLINTASCTGKNVSTFTEDLDINTTPEPSKPEYVGNVLLGEDASTSQLPHENKSLSLEGVSMTFPSDHMRMIQNINTLLAELALEKEQLMKTLSEESYQNSKLSGLNKDITRKLEAQMQRLELWMSQSMANDNIPQRQLDSHLIREMEPYADEGDEIFVKGKDLWGHVDGTTSAPDKEKDKPGFSKWEIKDAQIMSLILGSVESEIILNLRPFKTAVKMWAYLKRSYSQQNTARRFQLEHDIGKLHQDSLSISEFYSCFMNLWAEYTDIVYANLPPEGLNSVQVVHETTKRSFVIIARRKVTSSRNALSAHLRDLRLHTQPRLSFRVLVVLRMHHMFNLLLLKWSSK